MSTDSTTHRNDDLLRRIRGEYMEMPGLRLTDRQAQRLWALDSGTCRQVLDTLVASGFLRRTGSDHFVRGTDGAPVTPALRMAQASIAHHTLLQRAAS